MTYKVIFRKNTTNHNWHIEHDADSVQALMSWLKAQEEIDIDNIDSIENLSTGLRYPVKLLGVQNG